MTMADEFVTVAIADSNHVIETRRCRLVHLSDGARAALWRGLAWPIGDDDRIDVAGLALPLLPEASPVTPGFGLIEAEEDAWLVLDGSVTVRDAAVAALRQAGVEVLRSGPWLGDPVDGIAGTSFIRFIRPSGKDLRESIAKVIQRSVHSPSAQVDLGERIRVLTIELLEARALLARSGPAPKELQRSGEAEAELSRMQQENVVLLQENSDLRRQLAEALAVRSEPGRPARRWHDEIAFLLASFRPDLCFLRDSLTVIAAEFGDRRSCYRAVLELGPETLGRSWKRIQGAAGWWERHVSDGQDDSGRIYARRAERGWDVLVSHKSQQSRDVAWLARQ
jgi:hypothetical protein